MAGHKGSGENEVMSEEGGCFYFHFRSPVVLLEIFVQEKISQIFTHKLFLGRAVEQSHTVNGDSTGTKQLFRS